MAIRDGLGANVRIGGDATADTVASLQSINFPAGVTQIDLTTVDDAVSGYQKSRRGLKTGSFTFTCLYDTANTALLAAVADGSDPFGRHPDRWRGFGCHYDRNGEPRERHRLI